MHRRPFLALGLVAAACGDGPTSPTNSPDVTVSFAAAVTAAVSQVSVEISASDLPVPHTVNVAIVGGVASGTVTLPAGTARTITVRAYDAQAIETHRGQATIDVLEGTNVALSVTLEPLTGDVPFAIDLASYVVTLTPSAVQVAIGAQLQLSVTVSDALGPIASPVIGWGSTVPDIAPVDINGVVTGVAPGTATIVANYRGTVALATATVTP